MKTIALTLKQILSVPCPACRAAIGMHCKLYSGFGERNEPHVRREDAAVEMIQAQLSNTARLRTRNFGRRGNLAYRRAYWTTRGTGVTTRGRRKTKTGQLNFRSEAELRRELTRKKHRRR
jgi:hypothetical protein